MLEKHPRLLILLLIAFLTVLAINAGRWSPFTSTGGGDGPVTPATAPQRSAAATSTGGPDALRDPTPNFAASHNPAPPRDAMLEALRARLENPHVVPGEVLLTFRSREALDRFTRQAASLGLETLGTLPPLNAARVRFGSLERLRNALAAGGAEVAEVEGNLWLAIPEKSPQPDADNEGGATPFGQGMMSAINAAGDRTHWGDNVTVAILDTGILDHPTFAEGQIAHLDLVNDGQTFHSHGTSVASLVGGQNPQAPGVAPGAQILDIRVANAEGYTVGSVLAEGIVAAIDRGAQVINISLGGYGESALLGQAVAYAFQRGAVVVAAAGNEAYGELAIPAAYEGVISVGSVDAHNRQAYFSNSGEGLDLAAPGVGVVSAWDTDKIALVSGTSQSSALVAAAAAAYLGWGVAPGKVAARLRADARRASTSESVQQIGILMIKPPGRR